MEHASVSGHPDLNGVTMLDRIDDLLRQEIRRVGSQTYYHFHCAGAFLFVYDPSGLLEPAVATIPREYRQLHAVLPTYSVHDTPSRSGIASVAYEEGEARSQFPNLDERIGQQTREWCESYGIDGSMMAVRVDNCVREPLGVVVVFADRHLDHDFPDASSAFRSELTRIRDLLQRRRQAVLEYAASQHSHLAQDFFRESRRIRTVKGATEKFRESIAPLLRASDVYVAIAEGSGAFQWLSNVPRQQSFVMQLIDSVDPLIEDSYSVLNRREQDEGLWDQLQVGMGDAKHVWAAVAQRTLNRTIAYVAARPAKALMDHWSNSELRLMRDACYFLSIQVARAEDFEDVVKRIAENGECEGCEPPEFFLLCQMLKEYFGIDQVLVTRVTRNGSRYEIATRWPWGFGDNSCTMKSRPKHFPPPREGRLDIMEMIVSDCLSGQVKDVYVSKIGSDDPRFQLDQVLVDACNLRGNVYFVPCFTNGKRLIAHLKSILHLGRSDGNLAIPDDCIPMLQAFGQAFAGWLEDEEKRRVSENIEKIRNTNLLTADTLAEVCRDVRTACGSLDCTMFLNLRYVNLLDSSLPGLEGVQYLFKKFFLHCSEAGWDNVLGERAQIIRRMLDAFLGVDENRIEALVDDMIDDITRLVARACYLRVADNWGTIAWRRLFDLARHGLSDHEICEGLATLFADHIYLPGFGLTGWVIRYRVPMLLSDKSASELDRYYESTRSQARNPRIATVLDTLDSWGKGDLSRLAADPIVRPEHADHFSEDPSRRKPDDSCLCLPLGDVEILEFSPGVIRVSNAVTVKHTFDARDQEVLEAAATHVVNLLRGALMKQDAYRRDELVRRNYTDRVDHLMGKMKEKVGLLSGVLSRYQRGFSPEHLASVEEALSKLHEISDVADGQQGIAAMSAELRALPNVPRELGEARGMLQAWLKTVNVDAEVIATNEQEEITISGEDLITYWILIEELCRNMRTHAGVPAQTIRLSTAGDEKLAFLIMPQGSDESQVDHLVWKGHGTLLGGKEAGGGTYAVQNFSERFNMLVQVGEIRGREGEVSQVVRAVSRPKVGVIL